MTQPGILRVCRRRSEELAVVVLVLAGGSQFTIDELVSSWIGFLVKKKKKKLHYYYCCYCCCCCCCLLFPFLLPVDHSNGNAGFLHEGCRALQVVQAGVEKLRHHCALRTEKSASFCFGAMLLLQSFILYSTEWLVFSERREVSHLLCTTTAFCLGAFWTR